MKLTLTLDLSDWAPLLRLMAEPFRRGWIWLRAPATPLAPVATWYLPRRCGWPPTRRTMERNNRPAPPVSSERDDATREALVELLDSIGWKATADAQHSRLTAALPSLRALLAPPALPAGGNAYPVDVQQAHAIAVAATHDMPRGPEQELAYLMASARAMTGATLLDVFAGNALTGILADPSAPVTEATVAKMAFDYGAAMLAEKERRHA